ncbi:MAG: hypothetical protein NC331_14795 [Lachnospiraceae bacterium]|nr:hypothetical protein [Lachnospiraceae bacterium]MCM1240630.1 hypothetical protein [Lachnospiraceae bacterium]
MAMGSVDIREKIEAAEMILVGLGEEFQCPVSVRKLPEYERGKEILSSAGSFWLLPAWDDHCEHKARADTAAVLEKFANRLAEKDYFVVSVAMNRSVAEAPWKPGRLVMPCGTAVRLQCAENCDREPVPLTEEDSRLLEEVMDDLYEGRFEPEKLKGLGRCESCHGPMVLNNICVGKDYNEKGYLAQWGQYTKWLQGTLHHRVLILELGVGMRFPTVIRFPFEKAAFFNQKAEFCRINEKLYHLTEELKGKGQGISQNAIDCLRNL